MIEKIKAEILKEALSTPLQFNDTLNEVYILTNYVLDKTSALLTTHYTSVTNKMFVDSMISVLRSRSDLKNHKSLNLVWDHIIKKYGSEDTIKKWNKKRS